MLEINKNTRTLLTLKTSSNRDRWSSLTAIMVPMIHSCNQVWDRPSAPQTSFLIQISPYRLRLPTEVVQHPMKTIVAVKFRPSSISTSSQAWWCSSRWISINSSPTTDNSSVEVPITNISAWPKMKLSSSLNLCHIMYSKNLRRSRPRETNTTRNCWEFGTESLKARTRDTCSKLWIMWLGSSRHSIRRSERRTRCRCQAASNSSTITNIMEIKVINR